MSAVTVTIAQPNKATYKSGSVLQVSLTKNVQKSVQILKTGPQGPQGLQGVQGPKGDPGSNFNYTQQTPLNTWVIAHNLGYKPSVSTLSVGGVVMLGSVTHLSDNVVQIDFNTPVSGSAHLS